MTNNQKSSVTCPHQHRFSYAWGCRSAGAALPWAVVWWIKKRCSAPFMPFCSQGCGVASPHQCDGNRHTRSKQNTQGLLRSRPPTCPLSFPHTFLKPEQVSWCQSQGMEKHMAPLLGRNAKLQGKKGTDPRRCKELGPIIQSDKVGLVTTCEDTPRHNSSPNTCTYIPFSSK